MNEFYADLKRDLAARDYTTARLAREVGKDDSFVGRVLAGAKPAPADLCTKIAEILGRDAELFSTQMQLTYMAGKKGIDTMRLVEASRGAIPNPEVLAAELKVNELARSLQQARDRTSSLSERIEERTNQRDDARDEFEAIQRGLSRLNEELKQLQNELRSAEADLECIGKDHAEAVLQMERARAVAARGADTFPQDRVQTGEPEQSGRDVALVNWNELGVALDMKSAHFNGDTQVAELFVMRYAPASRCLPVFSSAKSFGRMASYLGPGCLGFLPARDKKAFLAHIAKRCAQLECAFVCWDPSPTEPETLVPLAEALALLERDIPPTTPDGAPGSATEPVIRDRR